MKVAGITAAVLCALILAPYVAWKIAYPTYTHRFRLVIEVEANGEVKRGSSVIEVSQTGIPEALYIIGKGSTAPGRRGKPCSSIWGRGGMSWRFSDMDLPQASLPRLRCSLLEHSD